jgi:hypothetical protein
MSRTEPTCHIGERHPGSQSIRLTNSSEDQWPSSSATPTPAPPSSSSSNPSSPPGAPLAEIDRRIKASRDEIDSIAQDQKRLRDNLSALKGSVEERALTSRYASEFNQQEDRLATFRKDLSVLNQRHQTASEDLSSKIESLNLDEKL